MSLSVEYPGEEEGLTPDVRELIHEVATEAEAEARLHLPGLADRLILLVYSGSNVIPEAGVGAAAIAPGVVACTVDPNHPAGLKQIVKSELRITLLHELHHLVRGFVLYGGRPARTFMDFVVAEGLATAFERDVGGRTPPWGEYPDEVRDWVGELLALPLDAPYHHWMFTHPDGRRWIGYRTGTYIADQAIAASGMSAAALAALETDEVLRLAGLAV